MQLAELNYLYLFSEKLLYALSLSKDPDLKRGITEITYKLLSGEINYNILFLQDTHGILFLQE